MHKTYQCSIETHQRILRYLHDQIIQEKKLPSIKEICIQLSITRGTFYLHFASMEEAKQELDEQCWNEFLDQARTYQQDSLQMKLLPSSFIFFEWLKCDLAYYQSFLLAENAVFTKNMIAFLKQRWNETDEMILSFAAYGIFGFLQEWLHGFPEKGAYEAAKQLDVLLASIKIDAIM